MPVVFKYFATIQFGTKTSHFLCMNCLESLENNSSDFKSYKLSQETDWHFYRKQRECYTSIWIKLIQYTQNFPIQFMQDFSI